MGPKCHHKCAYERMAEGGLTHPEKGVVRTEAEVGVTQPQNPAEAGNPRALGGTWPW